VRHARPSRVRANGTSSLVVFAASVLSTTPIPNSLPPAFGVTYSVTHSVIGLRTLLATRSFSHLLFEHMETTHWTLMSFCISGCAKDAAPGSQGVKECDKPDSLNGCLITGNILANLLPRSPSINKSTQYRFGDFSSEGTGFKLIQD
jgi:hypothetical protein